MFDKSSRRSYVKALPTSRRAFSGLVFLFLLGTLGGFLTIPRAIREYRALKLLRESGTAAEAVVTYLRVDRSGDDDDYYVTYAYTARSPDGDGWLTFSREQEVAKQLFNTLEKGGHVEITYAPVDPAVSRLAGTTFWNQPGLTFVPFVGPVVLIITAIYVRRCLRVLQLDRFGELTEGVIVDSWVKKDSEGARVHYLVYQIAEGIQVKQQVKKEEFERLPLGTAVTVYLGFATFPDATCIQAWRVKDGALLWETQLFDDMFDNAIFRHSDDEPLLVHGDALYVGRDSSRDGNGLTRIDLATGEVRALLEDVRGSRYVLPVVGREDTLVLFVQDDEFFKVWGVDATTGERLWSHRTGVTSDTDLILPYDLAYADDLAVAITDAGVVIIEGRENESGDRDRLYVRLLDLRTGEPLLTTERDFGYLSLNGMPVVVGDSVYLVAYLGLYRFDTLTGDLQLVLGEELHGN